MSHNYTEVQKAPGKRQFELRLGRGDPFMMLVADMCLWWDPDYKQHVVYYDRHRREFRNDAAAAWSKLIELGCEGLVPEL